MDFNLLHPRNELALLLQEKAASDEERRAYRQFANDHSVRLQLGSQTGRRAFSWPPKGEAQ